MEQHPIPQNISSYHFRLIGSMTLKQFIELAVGGVMGFLIYQTNLPFIFKWPLIFGAGLLGVCLAFLPFEERPLDVWLINFFKSIYSPTLFRWQKKPSLPDFFYYQAHKEKTIIKKALTPEEKTLFSEYLKSLKEEKTFSVFDQKEAEELERINQFLAQQTGLNPKNLLSKPSSLSHETPFLPSVKIRRLNPQTKILPQKVVTPPIKVTPETTATPTPEPRLSSPKIKLAPAFAPSVEIGTPFKVKSFDYPPYVRKIKRPAFKPADFQKPEVLKIPIPTPPEIANVVVGMVLDHQGKILPDAIVEIRDHNGMPVRASKTNKLGHFFIVTPLPNGEYEIEVEAPGFRFEIIKFKAEGKIIPPLKIQAKESKSNFSDPNLKPDLNPKPNLDQNIVINKN